ncbi:MAG TPA: hypothetical protein VFM71_01825 [Gemmatimonadaceae bacterium]|nr:hypothetical protein [Gemmatimonadaceae bacterium]
MTPLVAFVLWVAYWVVGLAAVVFVVRLVLRSVKALEKVHAIAQQLSLLERRLDKLETDTRGGNR